MQPAVHLFDGEMMGLWRRGHVGGVCCCCPGVRGGADDDVGAVVHARASVLAEVELERLNLQQTVFGGIGRGGREGGQKIKNRKRRVRERRGCRWGGGGD